METSGFSVAELRAMIAQNKVPKIPEAVVKETHVISETLLCNFKTNGIVAFYELEQKKADEKKTIKLTPEIVSTLYLSKLV